MPITPQISAFKKEIQNLKFRRGVVLFGPTADVSAGGFPLSGVDDTAQIFEVENVDLTKYFAASGQIEIGGSTANDDRYTIDAISYDDVSSPAKSTITTVEAIPDPTVDGAILRPLFTAGIIKDTNVQGDPIEYGPDNNGRTFVKAFDMTLAWALMQTGAPELQNLPALANPEGDGLYVVMTDGPFVAGSLITDTDIDGVVSFIEFANASVSPAIELNFSREESGITSQMKGVIEVADLTKLYAEPILLS